MTTDLGSAFPTRVARRITHRAPPEGFSAVLAWAALVIGLLAPAAMPAPIGWPAKFVIVLAFACVAPGSAIVSFVQLGDAIAAATVALILSLGISAAFAVGMVWAKAWHPLAAFITLAALSALGAAIRLAPHFLRRPLPSSTQGGPRTTSPSTANPARAAEAGSREAGGSEGGRGGMRASTAAAIPASASRSGGVTAAVHGTHTSGGKTLPARASTADATSVIPAVRGSDADQTAVIPAVRDAAPDQTAVIPAVRDAAPDQTAVIPAARDSGPDETAVIPAVRGAVAGRTSPGSGAAEQPQVAAPAATGPSYLVMHVCLISAALAAWIYGLTQSNTSNVGDYGLLSVMKPGFFTALGACVLGFLLALTAKRLMPAVLVGYIVLLVLIMHATVPALLANPEYAWTLRHVGIIEFIGSLGGVNNPLDIYQEWPTFFALMAQLVSVSGAHALSVAGWAPVFFGLADCLPVFAIARTLSNDPRVPYLTVFTFTAINWVGQDYLSPQAFAFLLCLGILMVMLRWLRRMSGPRVRIRPRALGRMWAWLQDGLVEVPYTSKAARRLALGVLYFVYAVVVASHQLSPYMIAASAVSLVAFGLIQPVRIVPILVGIAIAYVVPRYQVVDNYGIFDGLNFLHNGSGAAPTAGATPVPGRDFSIKVVRTLALSTWALTATTLFSARRKLGPVALPGTLAFTPFVMLLAQNYGGEAIYRVFLFSSPWCAYLLARQALELARRARSARAKRLTHAAQLAIGTPLLVIIVLASMQGAHGQLSFDQFTAGEVRGAKHLYASAPRGADIVYASQNFPGKLTARYGDIASGKLNELTLFKVGPTTDISSADIPDISAVDAYFSSLDAPAKYMVFSKSMIEYAHYFGYLPDGTLETLSAEVSTSQAFQLWYHDDGTVIFKYIG